MKLWDIAGTLIFQTSNKLNNYSNGAYKLNNYSNGEELNEIALTCKGILA